MTKYNTKQRMQFLSFLEGNPDSSFSAKDIKEAIGDISLSAVYRNLATLEKDGCIRKHGDRYEYIGSKKCRSCLHMNCKSCGKSFHLNGVFSEFIISNVLSSEKFEIDKNDTVFYGLCKSCRS